MIIPAILPYSRHELDCTLEKVDTFAQAIQLDVVDGVFATPASWPYNCPSCEDSLALIDFRNHVVELDLMIKDPEDALDMWLGTHPQRIVVHVESTQNLPAVLAHAVAHTYQLGLSFNNDTDLALLSDIDPTHFDYVQLMGIETIGVQGQPFDERVLSRIEFLKKTYPNLPIQIDGSVDSDTIQKLKAAGADRFVVGSAIIAAPDPHASFVALTNMISA